MPQTTIKQLRFENLSYCHNVVVSRLRTKRSSSFSRRTRRTPTNSQPIRRSLRLQDMQWLGLKNFALRLRQNCGVWRWSMLSGFWRVLGILVYGMYICMFMSIWNGFGICWVMELEWINETKWSTVRFCYRNVDFAKFWKLTSKIMFSNPKP